MQNDKKINIFLGVLCVGFLIFCIFTCIHFTQEKDKTVVLVKDVGYNDRLISDKTDALSNSKSPGELLLKGETPDGYINPDDYFKDTENILENDDGRIDDIGINSNETNPLPFRKPDEVLEIVKEEVIPQDIADEVKLNQNELLKKARELRNRGLKDLDPTGFSFFSNTVDGPELQDLCNENGGLIIPFSVENVNVLEPYVSYYNSHKDDLSFIFLNTSYFMRESRTEVKESLNSIGLSNDCPFYYDSEHFFLAATGLRASNYFIVNSDGFLVSSKSVNDVSNLSEYIDKLYEHSKMAHEMDKKIKEGSISTLDELLQYCSEIGLIMNDIDVNVSSNVNESDFS